MTPHKQPAVRPLQGLRDAKTATAWDENSSEDGDEERKIGCGARDGNGAYRIYHQMELGCSNLLSNRSKQMAGTRGESNRYGHDKRTDMIIQLKGTQHGYGLSTSTV